MVGIDVHLKSWKVAILYGNSIPKVFSQEPNAEVLVNYLRKHYPNGQYECVYEAGFCGFWIQERLAQLGANCKVVNAADVPTTDKEKQQKTDHRDCRKLARCLRDRELEFIHIPAKQLQYDRSIVRTRYKIKRDICRAKNRIVSHLHFYGVEEPVEFVQRNWTKAYVRWLEEIQISYQDIALKMLLEEFRQLSQLGKMALKEVRALSRTERYKEDYKLLLGIPGIGMLTSMLLVVEIGDIGRFRRLDHLCSMVGLVPNTHSSGEREGACELTKRGRKELRTALIESAWTAIRVDPELALCFSRYTRRMKGNQAIVRIAKKLLNRIRHVLLTKEEYVMATA